MVGADEGKGVGAEGVGGLEVVGAGFFFAEDGGGGGSGAVDAAIADDVPAGGCCHCEVDGCFEVGLVEAGEDAFGVGGFALAVEVDGAVCGIDGAVEAFTCGGVAAPGVDDNGVVVGEGGEG